jgi:hypothetical protein
MVGSFGVECAVAASMGALCRAVLRLAMALRQNAKARREASAGRREMAA